MTLTPGVPGDPAQYPPAPGGRGAPAASPETPPASPPARITVTLAARALACLRRVAGRTGLSQTDVVNRALPLYAFIDSEVAAGAEVVIRRDGRERLVKLL